MSCHGVNAFNPMCRVQEVANQAATDAFTHIAKWFGKAAADATTWLWKELNSATSIDLASPHLLTDLAATTAIAVTLCLGLFLLQIISGVLRRDPGSLGRAARGLVVALVASALALSVTKILLGVVDKLSNGVVEYTMNTNIEGLGRALALDAAISAYTHNPAMTLIFSLVILGAVIVIWAAMMIRKMMVIIAAVLTPLAFSGATADITRSWVRKWIEFMAAMIVSKLLLVIILMVGVSVVEGAGEASHPGPGQLLTQIATGSLILLMGGFAPWVAIKMFHFAGDSLHNAHMYAVQAPAGARSVVAAPQKLNHLHIQATATSTKFLPRSHGPAGSQASAQPQRPNHGKADGLYQTAAHVHGEQAAAVPSAVGTPDHGAGALHGSTSYSPHASGTAGAARSGSSAGGTAAGGSSPAGLVGGATVAAGTAAYGAARHAATAPGRAAHTAAAATGGDGSAADEAPASRPPMKPA